MAEPFPRNQAAGSYRSLSDSRRWFRISGRIGPKWGLQPNFLLLPGISPHRQGQSRRFPKGKIRRVIGRVEKERRFKPVIEDRPRPVVLGVIVEGAVDLYAAPAGQGIGRRIFAEKGIHTGDRVADGDLLIVGKDFLDRQFCTADPLPD